MRCSCSCPCMHITGQRFTLSSPTALAVRTDAAVASTRNAPQRGSKPLLSCARHCASPASQFQTEMERDRHSTCSLAESSAVWGLLMSIALQPSDGLAFGAAGLSSKNLDRARAGNISATERRMCSEVPDNLSNRAPPLESLCFVASGAGCHSMATKSSISFGYL